MKKVYVPILKIQTLIEMQAHGKLTQAQWMMQLLLALTPVAIRWGLGNRIFPPKHVGLPLKMVWKLQLVQNVVACAVTLSV